MTGPSWRPRGLIRRWVVLRGRGGEHGGGGISLFMVLATVAVIVIVGLVVDGGAKAAGLDKASRLAAEAARSALQVANLAADEVPETAAEREVSRYLTSAGATSWTTRIDGSAVVVTVTLSEPTKLLSLMGFDAWTVTASSRADGLYGLNAQ